MNSELASTQRNVSHVLLANLLLLETIHAQLVLLPVRLVLVLQLHALPVMISTSWMAQNAQRVILDALLALEPENAQLVKLIII